MKAVIIPQIHWEYFLLKVVDRIIKHSKEKYGCKFVSRETGEELCDDAIRGLFMVPVKQEMDDIERQERT